MGTGFELSSLSNFVGHRPPETESRPADSQPRRGENPSQSNYSSYTYAAGSTGLYIQKI